MEKTLIFEQREMVQRDIGWSPAVMVLCRVQLIERINSQTTQLTQPIPAVEHQAYIEGLARRDNRVVEAIYRDFAGRIRGAVHQWGGTDADAKDVFHDALMVVYHKAQSPDFKLTAGFYTYLYSVCRFIWLRRRAKKDNQTLPVPDQPVWTDDHDLEQDLERRERHRVFRHHLKRLDETCRRILELFFTGTSMTEIARQMQLKNEHTARTRKYRCAGKLEKSIRADTHYPELRTSAAIPKKDAP